MSYSLCGMSSSWLASAGATSSSSSSSGRGASRAVVRRDMSLPHHCTHLHRTPHSSHRDYTHRAMSPKGAASISHRDRLGRRSRACHGRAAGRGQNVSRSPVPRRRKHPLALRAPRALPRVPAPQPQ